MQLKLRVPWWGDILVLEVKKSNRFILVTKACNHLVPLCFKGIRLNALSYYLVRSCVSLTAFLSSFGRYSSHSRIAVLGMWQKSAFHLQLLLMPVLDGKALLYSFISVPEVRIGVAFGSGGSQTLPATELPGVSFWLVSLLPVSQSYFHYVLHFNFLLPNLAGMIWVLRVFASDAYFAIFCQASTVS